MWILVLLAIFVVAPDVAMSLIGPLAIAMLSTTAMLLMVSAKKWAAAMARWTAMVVAVSLFGPAAGGFVRTHAGSSSSAEAAVVIIALLAGLVTFAIWRTNQKPQRDQQRLAGRNRAAPVIDRERG